MTAAEKAARVEEAARAVLNVRRYLVANDKNVFEAMANLEAALAAPVDEPATPPGRLWNGPLNPDGTPAPCRSGSTLAAPAPSSGTTHRDDGPAPCDHRNSAWLGMGRERQRCFDCGMLWINDGQGWRRGAESKESGK